MEFISQHIFDIYVAVGLIYLASGWGYELFATKKKSVEVQVLIDNVVYYNKRKKRG